jgi:hypothetical protein
MFALLLAAMGLTVALISYRDMLLNTWLIPALVVALGGAAVTFFRLRPLYPLITAAAGFIGLFAAIIATTVGADMFSPGLPFRIIAGATAAGFIVASVALFIASIAAFTDWISGR